MPIFSATMGSVQPTAFANMTTKTMVRLTVKATMMVTSGLASSSLSTSSILTKFTAASVAPQSTATRISFQMTASMSLGSVSPMDRLRITAVELWEPELPPVPISIGIKPVSTANLLSASSKWVIIMLVNVADSMRNISQGIRRFQSSPTVAREYGVSEGETPLMRSKSSVVSSSSTSMTSSTVTMPTSLSSLSTTGMARRS